MEVVKNAISSFFLKFDQAPYTVLEEKKVNAYYFVLQ